MLKLQEIPIPGGGTSPIIDLAKRPMVVAEINGVNVPFYVSTGMGGKAGVPTGEWYPIMGIGSDGWFNKGGSEAAINNYFYDDDLRRVAEELNQRFGDLRGDPSLPKVPREGGAHLDVVNRDMKPMSMDRYSEDQFQRNIARVAEGKVKTPAAAPRAQAPAQDPKHRVFENIESQLGADNVKSVDFAPDGSVRIEVPDTYSRSNLAALGIDDPASLKRVAGSQPGTAIIEVPQDRLPSSLKIASHVDVVGQAPWQDVTRGSGMPAKYIDLEGMSPAEIDRISDSLKAQGVQFDIRDSGVFSEGGRVIAVDGAETMKIGRMQDGYDIPPEGHARKLTPSEQEAASKVMAAAEPETPKAPPAPEVDAPKAGGGFFGKLADGLGDLGKHAGVVGGAVIGGVAAGAAMLGGASKAEAAEVFGESAVPYGETMIEGAKGNVEEAGRAAVAETASNVASIGGMAVGAVVGQVLIPIPGVGAAVGAAVGGVVAGVAGAAVANVAMDAADKAKDVAKSVGGFFKKLNPFSKKNEDVAENKPEQKNEHDSTPQVTASNEREVETPSPSGLDLANVKPVEMPSIETADNNWDEKLVAQYYDPATLEDNRGANLMFARAHDADPNLVQTVYRPEPGSHEHLELQQMVDRDPFNTSGNHEIQQYAQLNDSFKLG